MNALKNAAMVLVMATAAATTACGSGSTASIR